jgi:hypothetical protein
LSWVRIDDGAPEHRKQLDAGPKACWLWLCGLAYCNRQKARDGFIPLSKVKLLYPGLGLKEAERLVQVGLWDHHPNGFVVHDYHDYQPDSERAEEIRAARSAAGRIGGKRSAEARAKQRAEADDQQSDSEANKQDPSKPPKQNSTPSRPVPSQAAEAAAAARVACPKDLTLTDDQRSTLESGLIPGWAIDAITLKFVAKYVGATSDTRTLEDWRKGLATAIAGDMNDPRRRPKKPDEQANGSDEDRAMAARF